MFISEGASPLIKYGKKKVVTIPNINIEIPTPLYTFFKYASKAQTRLTSFSAKGLYIKNTIDVVKPSSATFNTVKTDANKLDKPR